MARAPSSSSRTLRYSRSAVTIGSRRASSRPSLASCDGFDATSGVAICRLTSSKRVLEPGEPVDHDRAVAAASRSEARQDSRLAMLTSSIERSGGRVVSDWSQRPGV